MAQPGVYTIPPGLPFVDALAAGVLDRHGTDPLALSRVTVLLPTRRACRSLREAFLRLAGHRPILLPRIAPIGDIDEDELVLSGWQEAGLAAAGDVPPAVSGTRRQLLLARLVLAWKAAQGEPMSPDQAARLAAELARLLDQVQTERLDFSRLADLVPADYAAHWQITLDFLKILTREWPKILTEEGALDPAERRNRLLEAQARLWRTRPPADPVIAAGSTGSIPATADLLEAVAFLPQGAVVLPGLDCAADAATWAALDQGHPQYGLARLLERFGLKPDEVPDWPASGITGSPPGRAALVHQALRPAETTDAWRRLDPPAADSLDGVARIDCPGAQEEAGVIALLMRQVLEEKGRTAALVTPDRNLARRVAVELRRWGVEIDDSAGVPLSHTPPGAFLRLTAAMVAEKFAPLPLLAACKHPLAAAGLPPVRFRALLRRLEEQVLRGPRPGAGLAGLRAQLREGRDDDLIDWLGRLEDACAGFADLLDRDHVALGDLLRAHIRCAETLAATDTEPATRLWGGAAGEAAAEFVADLREAADILEAMPGRAYPALLDALMAERMVRPRFGLHPRLSIWGLLEARLQHADLLILGGLNEGTWPPEAPSDPWMSRPMRHDFGLPLPERRIGLAAHDFAQAFCAPAVALTRATRVEGTPTVPSRWLLRLDTLLQRWEGTLDLKREVLWLHWQTLLDRPEGRPQPIRRPDPRPPVAARPRKLSVTEIETWMRDPYAIYARRVLGLRALDPIDADPGAADYGEIIHQALDRFIAQTPDALDDRAEERLVAIGREVFGEHLAKPGVWAFWWPRFLRVAGWFVETERRRRADGVRPVKTEVSGSFGLDGPGGAFTVFAKADRIDRAADGSLVIIDYKTGRPPTPKEIQLGLAPQLPLEAAIAAQGGFAGVPGGAVGDLAFWRVSGGEPPGEECPALKGPSVEAVANVVATAVSGLEGLIAAFDDPAQPYWPVPRPDRAPRYTDYAHLARVKEWSAGGEDSE